MAKDDLSKNTLMFQGTKSLFSIRPKKDDVWELQLPNKKKQRKIVDRIIIEYHRGKNGRQIKFPRVYWRRLPNGRVTSLRVKWLLKYGKLVSRGQ